MIESGRISRREALAAGVGTAALTLLPRLRGERPPLPEQSNQYDAEFIGKMALHHMELELPKAHRAYAGYGNDGDHIQIDEQKYELQLLYTAFAIRDSEMPEITTDLLMTKFVVPAAMGLSRIFTLQPDLKHLVTRRIEPVGTGTGVRSKFVFQDYLGLRCTIGYEACPHGTEEGHTFYALEMLAGIKRDFVKTLAEINGYADQKNVGA